MNQPVIHKTSYTEEEYLAMEAAAPYKSEYIQGEVFAMTGGSPNHSIICFNLNGVIREAIRSKNCTGFESNMKLHISAADAYVYPDVMVVCGDIELAENTNDAIINPLLIIEALSPTTEPFDRGKKFQYYRTIASLKEYLLVSQDSVMVESYFKQSQTTWQYTVYEGTDEMLRFETLGYQIPLKEIYDKTGFV